MTGKSAPNSRASRAEVLELLRAELRATNSELPGELPENVSLTNLGLDSLDIVEFVARVEYRYHVSVADEQWQALDSLAKVADFIQSWDS